MNRRKKWREICFRITRDRMISAILIVSSLVNLIIVGAMFETAFACIQPPPGLVSWWPGDGNAIDRVDGNPGTLHGGIPFSAGKVDQAFSFDGVDDYVDFGTATNLDLGTNPFSFDLWVNFRSLRGEQVIIESWVEKFDLSSTGWGLTKLENNHFRLFGGTGELAPISTHSIIDFTPPALAINTWYHVAATRNGNTFTMYWDGVPVASRTMDINLSTTASLKIGHRGNPTDTPGSLELRGFFLAGLIDEVEIFNRALSESEIVAIQNAGSAGKCKVVSQR